MMNKSGRVHPAVWRGLAVVLLVCGLWVAGGDISAGASGAAPIANEWFWAATGSMIEGRYSHTATLLLDGRVLVVGGASNAGITAAAEVYDPATGEWSPVGAMAAPRIDHTATRLADGRVLVVGGRGSAANPDTWRPLASAELFDPSTGAWSPAGDMHSRRAEHAAALLPDGDVLVMGGTTGDDEVWATVERYDPETDTWTWIGAMNKARARHTATTLDDGRVLVAGGYVPGNVAELFDPATGDWRYTGGRATGLPDWSTATRLTDGRVLITDENAAALYDPVPESWTGGYSGLQRARHAAALMGDGRVLISGGYDNTANYPYELGYLDSAILFDPTTGQWATAGTMSAYRTAHTATTLLDGSVLVAGGEAFGPIDSAELYEPFHPTHTVFVPFGINRPDWPVDP